MANENVIESLKLQDQVKQDVANTVLAPKYTILQASLQLVHIFNARTFGKQTKGVKLTQIRVNYFLHFSRNLTLHFCAQNIAGNFLHITFPQ